MVMMVMIAMTTVTHPLRKEKRMLKKIIATKNREKIIVKIKKEKRMMVKKILQKTIKLKNKMVKKKDEEEDD